MLMFICVYEFVVSMLVKCSQPCQPCHLFLSGQRLVTIIENAQRCEYVRSKKIPIPFDIVLVYCRRPSALNRLVRGFSTAPSNVFAREASLSGVLYLSKDRSNLADVMASWERTKPATMAKLPTAMMMGRTLEEKVLGWNM